MTQLDILSEETAAKVAAISQREPPSRKIATQLAAARRIKSHRGPMHARIVNLIEMYGGLTRNEIVEHSGFKLQSVCARVNELKTANVLYDSDERRDGGFVVRRCVA